MLRIYLTFEGFILETNLIVLGSFKKDLIVTYCYDYEAFFL